MATVRSALRSVWQCPSCSLSSTPGRAFSTAGPLRALGPESPRYLDIPELVQPEKHRKKVLKGILPVPRDIFSRVRGGKKRVTEEYIQAATKDAQPRPSSSSPAQAQRNEDLARATELRKRNLREGLLALKARREDTQRQARHDKVRRRKRKEQLLLEDREDVKLTSPTITQLLLDSKSHGQLPDPNREERLAEKTARHLELEAAKTRERQDALHTLYMHAREFIVSEKQLDKAIDEAFGTPDNPKTWAGQGTSIWSEGPPPTVAAMLARATGATGPRSDDSDFRARTTKDRLGRIAEELTGGKM